MALHSPYFYIKTEDNKNFHVFHNCDGGLGFQSSSIVDEQTHQLILWAIEQGKRDKAAEIAKALGVYHRV